MRIQTTLPLSFHFSVSLFFLLFVHALFPSWKLSFFAPFLVLCFYRLAFIPCLWFSLFCGLIIDLHSAQHPFGLHALNFSLTTFFVYDKRQSFFANNWSTLPVLTGIFSFTSTGLQLLLFYILKFRFSFSWEWMLSDMLFMPFCDCIYAFICFTLPFKTLSLRSKRPPAFRMKRPK